MRSKIEQQLIDFIRVAVTNTGGITHVKRIVDLAGLRHVRTGFHGAPSHSPGSRPVIRLDDGTMWDY